ncbi:MAG: Lrp/AsnC family transcriptional regulator [Gammaproteobacteria bacterium]|nr:Lrp/AsnC family transcriptional regulator [Gammaproteobacteria bacterium]
MDQMPIVLSAADVELLAALQRDVTCSQVDLAAQAGMSRTSCWRRIREFEQSGLLHGKVGLVNPRLAGFGLQVLLHVTMTEHTDENRESFESHVRGLPEVTECFSVSGDRDYLLHVVAENMDTYTEFLNSQILHQTSVQSASSTFVLKRIKYTTELPLTKLVQGT